MTLAQRRTCLNALLFTAITALLALFVRQAHHYATFTATLASTSGMHDLTQMALKTGQANAQVQLGAPTPCAATSSSCWLSPAFTASAPDWLAVTLPRFDLRQHPLHAATIDHGVIRYLVTLDVPAAWRDQQLAFSPRYIGHRDFDVWINGERVLRRLAGGQNDIVTIPLPAQAVATGHVIIGIEGRLTAADEGIFHRSAMYFGPQAALEQLSLGKIYGMENYYLLSLVGKGAIFLVFAMLFAAGGTDFRLGHFLIYSLSATLENILIGDFLPPAFDLPLRVALCFPLKMLGITALIAFFYDAGTASRRIWRIGGVMTAGIALAAYDYGYGTHTITIQHLFAAVNAAMLTGSAAALVRSWRLRERAATLVLAIYGVLIAYEYLLRPFDGFDYRAMYDVGLFVFVAYLSARSLRAKDALIGAQAAEIAKHRINATIAQTSQMLAHDVRKPLTLIEMTASAVATETDPKRAAAILAASLPAIRRAKMAADAMIADVMAIGSAVRVDTKAVNVVDAIRSVLSDSAFTGSVRVHAGESQSVAVAADPHKFRRVITNLIDNAVAAAGPSGDVTITIASVNTMVDIRVFNSGSYVPPQKRELIFEPFFVTKKASGTGLGLTIVRRFVEAHGGKVRCVAEQGVGTTFEVLWPVASGSSADFKADINVLFGLFGITKHAGFAK